MILPETKIIDFNRISKDKVLQTNEDLINLFIKNKEVDSLAFYYLMKVLFENSTIYDYSPEKVTDITGYTRYFVTKHIRILKKRGLAYKHNDNLTFIGRKKLNHQIGVDKYYTPDGREVTKNKVHKCTILIFQCHSIYDIKLQLLSKILQQKISQQEYIRAHKEDRTKTSHNQFASGEILQDSNILSYRSMAKIFGMPLSTCHKIISHMKEKGFIELKTIKFQIANQKGKSSPEAHKAAKDILDQFYGYTYFDAFTQSIWAVPGSELVFPFYTRFVVNVTNRLFT